MKRWLKTILADDVYYTLALAYVCVMALGIGLLIAYILV